MQKVALSTNFLLQGGVPCTGRCMWQFASAEFMAQNLTLHVAKCQTAASSWELGTDHVKARDSFALNSSFLLSPLQRTVEGVCAVAAGPRRLRSPCLCFGNPIAALCWCKIKPARFPHPKLLPASISSPRDFSNSCRQLSQTTERKTQN